VYDLIVRGGTVVDGTGAPARTADVAVTDGVIVEVGRVTGPATQVVNADGALVTPGFVDVHTHYDGQATWDDQLSPSCWHGVTTVVMGNCGVGFAPVKPDKREWLIGLMEGVEDIPGAALSAGITWGWESFEEYLDAIDGTGRTMDIGAQVPHGPVRGYVMGERGARNEPATPDDIAAMAAIVKRGMEAGALGFTSSRTLAHRAIDGEPVPGTFAAHDELFGIGAVLGELGTGVFELAAAGALGEDLAAPPKEVAWMRELAAKIGRPVSFGLLQNNNDPTAWRELLDACDSAAAAGASVRPQVHGRTLSLLLGMHTFHPLQFTPTWGASGLGFQSVAEQVGRLENDTALRERILEEAEALSDDPIVSGFAHPSRIYLLGDPPEYEPAAETTVLAEAGRRGCSPWPVLLEWLLRDNGNELLNSPVANYSDGNLDAALTMLEHPTSTFGLGDGGAHVGQTCDASTTTFLLSHWARDRKGKRLSVESAVQKMTSSTADLYGLEDRGRVAPGYLGDLNVIDFESLQLRRPEMAFDLPADARRLIQKADGYLATIKQGLPTYVNGEATDARPGGLLRGARKGPA
jgi:N-acyl-D-amino-acid deacylase